MVGSQPARAEAPLAVKLEFRADDGCPDQGEFLSRLTSRAHVRLVENTEALRLRVVLLASGNGARGELRTGAAGEIDAREVEARSCEEVADALALIAALLVERTKRQQATRPIPLPQVQAPPRPEPRPPARPRTRLELGLQAVTTRPIAALPLAGAGVSLFVNGGMTWWLSAHYSRNDALASPTRARFGFGALSFGGGPPALKLGARLQVAALAVGEGGFLSAEGIDVDVRSSARRSYWAAGAMGRAQWQVSDHVGLFMELGGLVPVIERRFSTREPYVLVGRTASVAVHAALGLALGL